MWQTANKVGRTIGTGVVSVGDMAGLGVDSGLEFGTGVDVSTAVGSGSAVAVGRGVGSGIAVAVGRGVGSGIAVALGAGAALEQASTRIPMSTARTTVSFISLPLTDQ